VVRNWIKYTKDALIHELNQVDWEIQSDMVQGSWDEIKNKLVAIVDKLAPLQEFKNNSCAKSRIIQADIKNLTIERKRLLAKLTRYFDSATRAEVKVLNTSIRRKVPGNLRSGRQKMSIPTAYQKQCLNLVMR
jgi:hypothetical protein